MYNQEQDRISFQAYLSIFVVYNFRIKVRKIYFESLNWLET